MKNKSTAHEHRCPDASEHPFNETSGRSKSQLCPTDAQLGAMSDGHKDVDSAPSTEWLLGKFNSVR
jgi:hypothetical protein